MLPSRSCDYSSEVMLFLLLKLYRVFLHTLIPMWYMWSIITTNKVCLNFFKLFLYSSYIHVGSCSCILGHCPCLFLFMYLRTLLLCVLVHVSWDIVPVCSCSCILGYCPCLFLFMYLGTLSLFVLVHVSRDVVLVCSCSCILGYCSCMFLFMYLGTLN